MPERADIKPASMPALLPYLGFFEVLDRGRAFKVRLIGTKIVRDIGTDITGQIFDASSDDLVALRILYVINLVVLDRVPYHTATPSCSLPGKDFYAAESLNLPVSAGGSDVAFVLGAQVLTPRAEGA